MPLPVLALGPILKAVGGFFRAIPLWAWLAFAVLAAAFVYGEHKENQGMARGMAKGLAERDKVKAAWAAAVARGAAAIAKQDRKNAAAQAAAFAKGQAIGEGREKDMRDALAAKDRLVSDLRSGNTRLRDLWQGCLSGPQAGDAADVSGGPVSADELRGEIAGQISEADDADSRIARLIEFQSVLREQAQQTCGAVQ